jgi:outer membrane lipoprotein-sorting protein
MGAYDNMLIGFSTTLSNEDAGIKEDDEPPINGNITLQGEKYNLEYLGNTFIFDGKKLYVINHDDREITINEDDLSEDDGFIYPSKLLSFYQEGYNYKMGEMVNMSGRKIQYVELTPIDSNSEIIKVSLGIDAKSKHIYQLIQEGANGAKTTLTINQFKSNAAISEFLFVFDRAKYEKLDYIID